eukprot:3824475-Rhodomonas_salina.1
MCNSAKSGIPGYPATRVAMISHGIHSHKKVVFCIIFWSVPGPARGTRGYPGYPGMRYAYAGTRPPGGYQGTRHRPSNVPGDKTTGPGRTKVPGHPLSTTIPRALPVLRLEFLPWHGCRNSESASVPVYPCTRVPV